MTGLVKLNTSQRALEWNKTHKERRKQILKKYYESHKKELYEKKRIWLSKQDKEEFRRKNREWYFKNREKCIQRVKNWQKNNPEKAKLVTQKYVKFHGKPKRLDHNPRTGICSNCKRSIQTGEIKVTNIHHDKYDESNPLAHTRELCVRCHRQFHTHLRREK